MPAKSKVQRKAAGMALAAKKGKMPRSQLRGAATSMMSMSREELEHMAKTKEMGLPKRKQMKKNMKKKMPMKKRMVK